MISYIYIQVYCPLDRQQTDEITFTCTDKLFDSLTQLEITLLFTNEEEKTAKIQEKKPN